MNFIFPLGRTHFGVQLLKHGRGKEVTGTQSLCLSTSVAGAALTVGRLDYKTLNFDVSDLASELFVNIC